MVRKYRQLEREYRPLQTLCNEFVYFKSSVPQPYAIIDVEGLNLKVGGEKKTLRIGRRVALYIHLGHGCGQLFVYEVKQPYHVYQIIPEEYLDKAYSTVRFFRKYTGMTFRDARHSLPNWHDVVEECAKQINRFKCENNVWAKGAAFERLLFKNSNIVFRDLEDYGCRPFLGTRVDPKSEMLYYISCANSIFSNHPSFS